MGNGLAFDIRCARGGFRLAAAGSVPPSGITALFGASGSGKTTLLRALAGLEPGAEGRIAFGPEVWQDGPHGLPPHRRGAGLVFQDQRLFEHLDVTGNLRYAARRSRSPRWDEVVDALDLAPLLRRRIGTLSGGERSRVAIGRTLLSNPRLLLLDEPLAALDRRRKGEILPYLAALPARFGLPVILVTHAVEEVVALARRMLVLSDGRIAVAGETGQVLERLDLMALGGRFEGGALLEARVTGHDPDWRLTRLEAAGQRLTMPMVPLAPGEIVRLRVRARDVMLATERPAGLSARNVLTGRVGEIVEEPDTAFAEVFVALSEAAQIRARLTRAAVAELGLAPGRPVFAIVKSVAFDRRTMKPG